VKELTSNYTVSCLPLTTPPLNSTIPSRNRTKNITPKWKFSRTDYLGTGLGPNKYRGRLNNAAYLIRSIYTIECLLFSLLFLLV